MDRTLINPVQSAGPSLFSSSRAADFEVHKGAFKVALVI